METLGYTHMAAAYEETYGSLRLRTWEPPRHFRWSGWTSAIAIATLLAFGGLTAMVGSALSPSGTSIQQQAPGL